MANYEESYEQFKIDLGRFLLAIQTARTVDLALFQKIDREAAELAHALKEQFLVPKSLLNELWVAAKVLRAEAPYLEGDRNNLTIMADKLEMIFEFILKGETPEDRRPGVPRIV